MGFWSWVVLIVVGIIVLVVLVTVAEEKKVSKMSPEQRVRYRKEKKQAAAEFEYGRRQREIVCPHCQTKGNVHTKSVKQKKGISGGKATAAVFTLGVSMLATGG